MRGAEYARTSAAKLTPVRVGSQYALIPLHFNASATIISSSPQPQEGSVESSTNMRTQDLEGTQVRPRHGVLWCPGMMMRKDLAVLVLVILTRSTAVFSALGQESGLFNSPPDHEFQFSRLMYLSLIHISEPTRPN